MKLSLVGGTGKEGAGLSVRWARAGHDVTLGSRDLERARTRCAELSASFGVTLRAADNESACRDAEIVVLCVPYGAHGATLAQLAPALQGKLVLDITVPLVPPKVREVHLPAGTSAAQEAAAVLGNGVRLVAALHHVSSLHLADPSHPIDCDVLLCGDDLVAKESVANLIGELGLRGLDAGPLCNAVALESLTPVLLYMNRRYNSPGAGIRITGIAG